MTTKQDEQWVRCDSWVFGPRGVHIEQTDGKIVQVNKPTDDNWTNVAYQDLMEGDIVKHRGRLCVVVVVDLEQWESNPQMPIYIWIANGTDASQSIRRFSVQGRADTLMRTREVRDPVDPEIAAEVESVENELMTEGEPKTDGD